MSDTGIIGFVLIVMNVIFSYRGFTSQAFFDRYKFEVDRVLINKDYKRLITSGFLHVNWTHLILNMISLYAFSGLIEISLGGLRFLIIYFASLICGDLLALWVHRNHGDYSAVGASGAICGIMFASIALFPGMDVGFIFLPISIPGWLFAILFVLFTIYGIKSGKDNIGHEAHLGGALAGMILAVLMQPAALAENYLTILIITVPTVVFIYLIITRPHILLVDNFYYKTHKSFYSIDHKYNRGKREQQMEVDRILDKISKRGMGSLTSREKEILKEHSRNIR